MPRSLFRKRLLNGLLPMAYCLLMGSANPFLGPLAGRTIVLDPGHGGKTDSGAVGRSGLREAFVNLDVALVLQQLLEAEGAKVVLTRTSDQPLVPNGDAEGRQDLKARAEVANNNRADLFISLHHNDTTSKSDPRLETQVYWKLDDAGPSQDFGRLLLNEFEKTLKMPSNKLIAGNFAVLRHSNRPAVLAEPLYLTNPHIESQLRTPEFRRREAEAYARAVLAYFAKGVPVIEDLEVVHPSTLRMHVESPVSPVAETQLVLDGEPILGQWDADSGTLSYMPAKPLANGPHRLRVQVRNQAGNAAWAREQNFRIDRPARQLKMELLPHAQPPGTQGPLMVRAVALDEFGLPVADGTPVALVVGNTSRSLEIAAGEAIGIWGVTQESDGVPVTASCQGVTATATWRPAPFQEAWWLVDWETRRSAHVFLDGQDMGELRAPLRLGPLVLGVHQLVVEAPGYQPAKIQIPLSTGATYQELTLNPLYGAKLFGKKIAIDPLPSLNNNADRQVLDLARQLATLLTRAGAEVVITRQSNERTQILDSVRVQVAQRFESDLYVSIGPGPRKIAHYYTSQNGRRLANLLKNKLGFALSPEAGYVLSHTHCPAVVVTGPPQNLTKVVEGLVDYF